MGYDLNYWKETEGTGLPVTEVYQRVCCDGQAMEGLELLPLDAIRQKIAEAFPDWSRPDPATYEDGAGGCFQLSTTPQSLRADCYGVREDDMRKLSCILREFGCPLYDPQMGARFDSLSVWIYGEAEVCREAVEDELAKLFPDLKAAYHFEPTPSGAVPIPRPEHPVLELFAHRGKSVTKVSANIYFGRSWTSRPTQCKNILLTDPETTKEKLSQLARTVIGRAAEDMRQRNFYC